MGIFDSLRKKKVVKTDEDLQTSQAAAVRVAQNVKTDDDATPKKKAAPKKTRKAKTTEDASGEPIVNADKKTAVGTLGAYLWLKRPHISEKAAMMTEHGVYVFDVPTSAEKISVKQSIEGLYKVKVVKIRMIRRAGKPVNRSRHHAKRVNTKKAIVTLAKGQKLDLYEGV